MLALGRALGDQGSGKQEAEEIRVRLWGLMFPKCVFMLKCPHPLWKFWGTRVPCLLFYFLKFFSIFSEI